MSAALKRRTFASESDVKRIVRDIIDMLGGFSFMPPANGFGRSGVSDIVAVINGKAIAIETKFGRNKPTALQLQFGEKWLQAGGFFMVVNESNLMEFVKCLMDFLKRDGTSPAV